MLKNCPYVRSSSHEWCYVLILLYELKNIYLIKCLIMVYNDECKNKRIVYSLSSSSYETIK